MLRSLCGKGDTLWQAQTQTIHCFQLSNNLSTFRNQTLITAAKYTVIKTLTHCMKTFRKVIWQLHSLSSKCATVQTTTVITVRNPIPAKFKTGHTMKNAAVLAERSGTAHWLAYYRLR